MEKILISGGAGFIGSHLAEAFLYAGYEVIVIDNLSSGKMENLRALTARPFFHFYKADILDQNALRDIFAAHTPHIISHQAAQKSLPASFTGPAHDAQVNIIGLLHILLLAQDFGVGNIMLASSGGALARPEAKEERSRETDIPCLLSPYSVSKFAAENYLQIFASRFGYAYSILRYANVYGPRQEAEGECGVIPIFLRNLRAGRPSQLMTYPGLESGCSRDFIYISDVVRANLMLARNPVNCAVNIGTGCATPILRLYQLMQQLFATDIPIFPIAARAGDVRYSVLNSDRMNELADWVPEVDLETGLCLLKSSLDA